MKYGYFDLLAREYVITDPHTPVKWINYVGTRAFGGFVDHTGGALLCKDDPAFNRITKYIQQMPSSEFKGETFYLRLRTAAGFQIVSPFCVPGLNRLDHYECHVGLDYTRIVSEVSGIRTEALIFVPRASQTEVRRITVTNISDRPVTVDVIPLVEFTHPDALNQLTNADWTPQTMQCRARQDGEFTILVEYPFMTRDTRVNYLTSNFPASSFETDRKQFLGENEYGTFAAPLSLRQAELGNHQANRGDLVGVLMHSLGELLPGESRTLITQLGQAASIDDAMEDIRRFRREDVVQAELEKIKVYWQGYLAAQQVQTPDESMDCMLNLFNPRQCLVTKNWSRYLSYYQLGLGARGIGMRDSAQDCLGVMANAPEEAAGLIRLLLSFQNPNGSCMHQFNPLTLIANEGDSLEMEDRPHYYSDDHLWLVLAVTAYLKESGNLSFLDEEIPFYDSRHPGEGREPASVLEHLWRGLAFTAHDLGRHGLPLLGFADWNDTVNLPTGAESLFSANLYGLALREMVALLVYLGKKMKRRHTGALTMPCSRRWKPAPGTATGTCVTSTIRGIRSVRRGTSMAGFT
jgi:cellobiose phosphorylase